MYMYNTTSTYLAEKGNFKHMLRSQLRQISFGKEGSAGAAMAGQTLACPLGILTAIADLNGAFFQSVIGVLFMNHIEESVINLENHLNIVNPFIAIQE